MLKLYMFDVILNNSRPNTYYIVVIPALKLKNVKSDTMWLKFNAWYLIIGFVIMYKHLILFLIFLGSCPSNISIT